LAFSSPKTAIKIKSRQRQTRRWRLSRLTLLKLLRPVTGGRIHLGKRLDGDALARKHAPGEAHFGRSAIDSHDPIGHH
jgi:hypothetical protein